MKKKKNRSVIKHHYLRFFLKNNFLIIHARIKIHIITSPNTIIAPAPITLVVKITIVNNIINVNAKIPNNIIISYLSFFIIARVNYAKMKEAIKPPF